MQLMMLLLFVHDLFAFGILSKIIGCKCLRLKYFMRPKFVLIYVLFLLLHIKLALESN